MRRSDGRRSFSPPRGRLVHLKEALRPAYRFPWRGSTQEAEWLFPSAFAHVLAACRLVARVDDAVSWPAPPFRGRCPPRRRSRGGRPGRSPPVRASDPGPPTMVSSPDPPRSSSSPPRPRGPRRRLPCRRSVSFGGPPRCRPRRPRDRALGPAAAGLVVDDDVGAVAREADEPGAVLYRRDQIRWRRRRTPPPSRRRSSPGRRSGRSPRSRPPPGSLAPWYPPRGRARTRRDTSRGTGRSSAGRCWCRPRPGWPRTKNAT